MVQSCLCHNFILDWSCFVNAILDFLDWKMKQKKYSLEKMTWFLLSFRLYFVLEGFYFYLHAASCLFFVNFHRFSHRSIHIFKARDVQKRNDQVNLSSTSTLRSPFRFLHFLLRFPHQMRAFPVRSFRPKIPKIK